MDSLLKNALEFSNYQQTLNLQRKTLKEKVDAQLTIGHNGGIFKIDRSLIVFIQFLIDSGRTTDIPLIDVNENPVLVKDLITFRDDIVDRYFSSIYEYYTEYQKIKTSRSVEALLDL